MAMEGSIVSNFIAMGANKWKPPNGHGKLHANKGVTDNEFVQLMMQK